MQQIMKQWFLFYIVLFKCWKNAFKATVGNFLLSLATFSDIYTFKKINVISQNCIKFVYILTIIYVLIFLLVLLWKIGYSHEKYQDNAFLLGSEYNSKRF